MTKHTALDLSQLSDYIETFSVRESDIFRELREATAQLENSNMQIAAEQGQFMQLLIKVMGAKRALEIGTFTGYSALSVATALPANGHLICCDINEEWTSMAKTFWEKANVADKITLILGDALATMNRLIFECIEPVDFVFIDADKINYVHYYEQAKQLLSPGGLIAIDNVLWRGAVANENIQDPDTVAIRAFNEHVYNDQSVDISLIPIADGLTLARLKE